MKTIGIHFTTLALFICGIVLAGIGLSITLSPSGFYASSGIALGMISLAMLKGAARSAKNENGAETTAIS